MTEYVRGVFDARDVPFGPLTAREFHCETCGARCTRGTEGDEYGHKYGCPERPPEWPVGASSQDSYYRGESDA